MAPSILNRRTRRRGTGGSLPDPVATHTWASSAARSCCRNMSCRPGTATPDTVRTGPCRAHYTSGVTGRQASLPPVSNEVSHGNEPSAAVFVEGGWVGKGSILAYPGRAKSFRPGPIGAFEAQRMAATVAGLQWSRAWLRFHFVGNRDVCLKLGHDPSPISPSSAVQRWAEQHKAVRGSTQGGGWGNDAISMS